MLLVMEDGSMRHLPAPPVRKVAGTAVTNNALGGGATRGEWLEIGAPEWELRDEAPTLA